MTRKDYVLISTALSSIDNDLIRISASRVLAYALLEDNRRFNIERFMEACKKKETTT